MKIILLILFGIAICIYFLAKLVRSGGRINEYFSNAVRVYLWLQEEDARHAAITAARTASSSQRELMARYLDELDGDLSPFTEKVPELNEISKCITQMVHEISAKDWTIMDIKEAKEVLEQYNKEYLEALNRSDPTVFSKRYPSLFAASNIMELVEAAEQEKRTELEKYKDVGEQLLKLKNFQEPGVRDKLEKGIRQIKKDLEQ